MYQHQVQTSTVTGNSTLQAVLQELQRVLDHGSTCSGSAMHGHTGKSSWHWYTGGRHKQGNRQCVGLVWGVGSINTLELQLLLVKLAVGIYDNQWL
jgi:hypothetical protein